MTEEIERLIGVAVARDGVVHQGGPRGHWEVRSYLNDEDPTKSRPGDTDGFMTSKGCFVGRSEANRVAAASGQCSLMGRPMLSSDVDWDTKPPKAKATEAEPAKRRFRP